MANTNFISAANLFGWGQSFNATGKFPLIAKRVWETYADMLAFVSDTSDVCPAGVVLTVINDTDSKKNGAYFVASCPTLENPELEVKVEKIGSGEVLTAESYSAAKALAKDELRGTLIYVTADSEEGTKGFYIVYGDDDVQKLGVAPATGDLSGDVTNLKSEVNILIGGVDVEGSVDNKIATALETIDLTPYATITYVDNTFVKKDGYVAYSQAEKDKLAGIAEGAQVNIIEKVIFNGQEVVADAQTKTITLTTPQDVVRGLADGEKFLSLDTETGKLGATVGLTYYTDTTGETPVYEIRLTGKNNQVISTIDAKGFVKDGMLNTVELLANPDDQAAGTYLVFTWNTEAGVSDPMYVPVTDLIDVYTSGDGIEIKDKVITAKVKTADPYIEVTTEGIASKGIDNAILTAKNAVIGVIGDTKDAETIYGAKAYANGLVVEVKETFKDYTVKSVDPTAVAGISVVNTDGVVKANVDTNELTTALVGDVGETGPVSGATIKLGQAIVDGDEEIIAAGSSVQAAIQSLSGQIQSAVAGGITGISGDEYISVTGGNAAKSITLNVANVGKYLVEDDSALYADEETGKLSIV